MNPVANAGTGKGGSDFPHLTQNICHKCAWPPQIEMTPRICGFLSTDHRQRSHIAAKNWPEDINSGVNTIYSLLIAQFIPGNDVFG
jgi:hypothetical protein